MPAPVMSQLENTSAILGEYMLKGWTLTDLHCSQCRVTPLMREPSAAADREGRERVQFCALCDGRPEARATRSTVPAPAHASSTSSSRATPSVQAQPTPTDDDDYTSTRATPATTERTGPSQSEDAAASISSLLLNGYSLLNENCPNSQCKGIPLVGYPRRPDGSKDGRKMCVSCDGRWADQASIDSGDLRVTSAESPRSKARRELYGLTADGQAKEGKRKQVDRAEFEDKARESAERLQRQAGTGRAQADAEGTDIEMDEDEEAETPAVTKAASTQPQSHILPIRPSPIYKPTPPTPASALGQSLSRTSDSLSQTLSNLSASLERASQPPRRDDEGKWFVDLKLHTEAIKDVLGVIGQVERARRVGY